MKRVAPCGITYLLGALALLAALALPRVAVASGTLPIGHWQGPPERGSRYRFCVEITKNQGIVLTLSPNQQRRKRLGDLKLVVRGRYEVVQRSGDLVELRVSITRMDQKGYLPCRKWTNSPVDAGFIFGRYVPLRRSSKLQVRLTFTPARKLSQACVLGVRQGKKHWFCQPMRAGGG